MQSGDGDEEFGWGSLLKRKTAPPAAVTAAAATTATTSKLPNITTEARTFFL